VNHELKAALIERLTALADDELILGHRNSEWTGHAPILEEDIALANLAQDELGHARLYYDLRRELDGSDPDRLVYFRAVPEWRSAQLLELPKGDWAFTMLRQYLFDTYEHVLLSSLRESSHEALKQVAEKILREERFHLQHSALWVERLGLGTEASHRRMQAALDTLWPCTKQLFVPLEGDELLVQAGILPDLNDLEASWQQAVVTVLEAASLGIPDASPLSASRREHSEHLAPLLSELQEVARLEPAGTEW
jgi:ring-1,2-phenylacetyl-CoA epoxidase subunit PaaC